MDQVSVSDPSPAPGETVRVVASVRNTGDYALPDVDVGFFFALNVVPDLVVRAPERPGDPFAVGNLGPAEARGVDVEIRGNRFDGPLVFATRIESLAPGQWVSIVPGTDPGPLTLVGRADPADVITELDEGNNAAAVLGTVDLTVTASGPAEPIAAGSVADVHLGVTNRGPADATSIHVHGQLPAGTELVSSTTPCRRVDETLVCVLKKSGRAKPNRSCFT